MPSLPNLDLQKSGDGVSYSEEKRNKHPIKYLVRRVKLSDARPPAAVHRSVS